MYNSVNIPWASAPPASPPSSFTPSPSPPVPFLPPPSHLDDDELMPYANVREKRTIDELTCTLSRVVISRFKRRCCNKNEEAFFDKICDDHRISELLRWFGYKVPFRFFDSDKGEQFIQAVIRGIEFLFQHFPLSIQQEYPEPADIVQDIQRLYLFLQTAYDRNVVLFFAPYVPELDGVDFFSSSQSIQETAALIRQRLAEGLTLHSFIYNDKQRPLTVNPFVVSEFVKVLDRLRAESTRPPMMSVTLKVIPIDVLSY